MITNLGRLQDKTFVNNLQFNIILENLLQFVRNKLLCYLKWLILYWLKRIGLKLPNYFTLRPKKIICVFLVSRPYLGFCSDPKHFIVNCKQNIVKFDEKWKKMY